VRKNEYVRGKDRGMINIFFRTSLSFFSVSVASTSKDTKKAEEMEVSDFVALPEKDKVEVFMRVNSKIRSLEVKVKVLQVFFLFP
jgi:hypothetical protein